MNLATFLHSLPMWLVNGVMRVLYWLAGHVAEALSLLSGFVIAFGFDPYIQARASERPRRYERGSVQTAPPAASYFTLGVLGLWLVISLTSHNPVPILGAAMWMIGLLGILAVPEERFNQLWWVKTGLLVYSALVLLLRFGLPLLQRTNPSDWVTVIGSGADAQAILQQTQNNVALIGMLFIWVLYPVGYAAMLLNRFVRNPKPLFSIWLEAGDVLRRLRTRN